MHLAEPLKQTRTLHSPFTRSYKLQGTLTRMRSACPYLGVLLLYSQGLRTLECKSTTTSVA